MLFFSGWLVLFIFFLFFLAVFSSVLLAIKKGKNGNNKTMVILVYCLFPFIISIYHINDMAKHDRK
ncbi:hypothetical protein A9G29_08995 [Gilliamella sp. Fer2-1]|nr:hypothetical protein A9G29_08995 [Gilliamella apicola]